MDKHIIDIEYTDTFGGQANYSWVKRAELEVEPGTSSYAVMRRAKRAMGLTGVYGRTTRYGDMIEFVPRGMCTVMFASVRS